MATVDTVYNTNYDGGDIAWVLASTALVWLMVPGMGFFYSGQLRRKNALSMIYLSLMCIAVVSFQWFFWGFSITFSETGSPFWGNLDHFALKGALDRPGPTNHRIPALVFSVFQLMFASITPMIALGGVSERSRLGPLLVFVFIWATLVYDPIAYWTWNPRGWYYKLGGLDFAGGTPVHISSGSASLAISWYLGPRRGWRTADLEYPPHNATYVALGTVFLWVGWFGFNGGSALGATLRAAMACIVTNLAASMAGLTWMMWDAFAPQSRGKYSIVAFCSGAIAGLVAITPASGYVGAPAAVLYGIAAGTACRFASAIPEKLNIDDAGGAFASHAIGGIVGNLLTGIFAQKAIVALDGSTIKGGWLDRHWVQLPIQFADSAAGLGYSFVVTSIILRVMDRIPFLRLKFPDKDAEDMEAAGVDYTEMGAYAYDYVGADPIFPQYVDGQSVDRVSIRSEGMQLRPVGARANGEIENV